MRFAVITALCLATVALADEPEAERLPPPSPGPRTVELDGSLSLALPAGYGFFAKAEAAKLLEANGSFHHDNLLGVVVPLDEAQDWAVVMRYEPEGFIKDDEKIDAAELLSTLREGQEAANEERQANGFPSLTLGEWVEAPHYDKEKHHLVWGLPVSANDGTSINYNTRVLGRRGYVSLNLVASPENIDAAKPHADTLLAATSFTSGARYEDFNASSDKVAEYGLAGLVLGGAGLGAAKLVKVGLLAKFGKGLVALLLAGKKFIVVALVGLGALLRKLFGGKGTETVASGAPPPPTSNDGQPPA